MLSLAFEIVEILAVYLFVLHNVITLYSRTVVFSPLIPRHARHFMHVLLMDLIYKHWQRKEFLHC